MSVSWVGTGWEWARGSRDAAGVGSADKGREEDANWKLNVPRDRTDS